MWAFERSDKRHVHTADVLAAGLVDTKALLLGTSTQPGGTMVSGVGLLTYRVFPVLFFFSFSAFPAIVSLPRSVPVFLANTHHLLLNPRRDRNRSLCELVKRAKRNRNGPKPPHSGPHRCVYKELTRRVITVIAFRFLRVASNP